MSSKFLSVKTTLKSPLLLLLLSDDDDEEEDFFSALGCSFFFSSAGHKVVSVGNCGKLSMCACV
jgi:hypothetical protein